MIQPNTIPGSLSWSHINNREYQLHREGLVLATLKIDDDLDSSVTGGWCGRVSSFVPGWREPVVEAKAYSMARRVGLF